jgi:hypothetical protein
MPSPAARTELAGTEKTPTVLLDPAAGKLKMTGCSIPENADRFFAPLFDLVDSYACAPAIRTTVQVSLTYFNSSSAKYLLDIFKRLEDLHASGTSKVQLEWYHAPGDMDMAEAGQDYRSLLEFPVKVLEDPDRF